jgi:acyl-CoA dehydrogenase
MTRTVHQGGTRERTLDDVVRSTNLVMGTYADILARVRAFVDERLIPAEAELLGRRFGEAEPRLRALREEVKAAGLWLPFFPQEHGGMGLPLGAFAHVSAALGRTPYGHYVFNCQAPDVGNMELLQAHASPAHRERWLAPLARGEVRSCFAMTEPGHAGSNPVWMSTRAVRDGSGWVIDGHKWFTSGADGAAVAIVMAVTDPDAAPHARASMFVVPTDTAGYSRVRNIPVMGDAGDGWASHGEVRFTSCRVPADALLGERGKGFGLAQERLGPGRIHHCMRWIGICERAFEMTCRHAATRELAPGRLLASRQVIQHGIADAAAEIHAARLLVLDAAAKLDAFGARRARDAISMIKYHVAGVLQRVLDLAVQVHGALGLTDDLPLAWWYRHERGARIYDGPDEVHRTAVARRILRGYGATLDD